jgi:hypothetical protein
MQHNKRKQTNRRRAVDGDIDDLSVFVASCLRRVCCVWWGKKSNDKGNSGEEYRFELRRIVGEPDAIAVASAIRTHTRTKQQTKRTGTLVQNNNNDPVQTRRVTGTMTMGKCVRELDGGKRWQQMRFDRRAQRAQRNLCARSASRPRAVCVCVCVCVEN